MSVCPSEIVGLGLGAIPKYEQETDRRRLMVCISEDKLMKYD